MKRGLTPTLDERRQRDRAMMPSSKPRTETIFDRPLWTPLRDRGYSEMLKRIDADKRFIK